MLVDHLKRVFAERSRKNPAYSLRAFSRSLGMDSSTVSAILKGKRPITLKMARKLIEGLHISDPQEAQALIVETLTGGTPMVDFAGENYQDMNLEAAETIASWEHFAILALLEIKDFNGQERSISERLNIPIGVVIECLTRLEKLNLVGKSKKGGWELTGENMATPSHVVSGALREGHRQNITKALEALDTVPLDARDYSGITMAVNSDKLPEARKMIQQFRRKLAAFMENGKPDSVYRLNVQLFPFTQEKKQ